MRQLLGRKQSGSYQLLGLGGAASLDEAEEQRRVAELHELSLRVVATQREHFLPWPHDLAHEAIAHEREDVGALTRVAGEHEAKVGLVGQARTLALDRVDDGVQGARAVRD